MIRNKVPLLKIHMKEISRRLSKSIRAFMFSKPLREDKIDLIFRYTGS